MSVLKRLHGAISPLSLSIVFLTTLFGGLTGLALAGDAAPPAAAPEAGEPPQNAPASQTGEELDCALCHHQVVEVWENSPHHLAFSNEHFQATWEEQDQDPACLECHTTGYSPATGEYVVEGVTCVECHGQVPLDHPQTPADLTVANTVCRECHTVTYAEFRASLHEAAGLQCTSCHYAHENGLRLGDQVSQCLNCHALQLEDFAHDSHVTAGLECRHCHGYVEPGQEVPPDGLAPTGHDFRESVRACLDCHEDIQLSPVNGEVGESTSRAQTEEAIRSGEEAAMRISELQATVDSLVLQNRNSTALSVAQGGAGGLVVGGIAIWLITRRRVPKVGSDHDEDQE
jgi:hypothetical protein